MSKTIDPITKADSGRPMTCNAGHTNPLAMWDCPDLNHKEPAPVIFDYGTALRHFEEMLATLEAHIREHRMHEDWEKDAGEIKEGRRLLLVALDDTYETEPWDAAFDYLRERMRAWWC